jgi:hypothetical protein
MNCDSLLGPVGHFGHFKPTSPFHPSQRVQDFQLAFSRIWVKSPTPILGICWHLGQKSHSYPGNLLAFGSKVPLLSWEFAGIWVKSPTPGVHDLLGDLKPTSPEKIR